MNKLTNKAIIVFISVFILFGLCAVSLTIILSLNDTRKTNAEIQKIERNEPIKVDYNQYYHSPMNE